MKNLYIKKVFIFSILALSIFSYGIAEASITKTLVKGVALGTGVGVKTVVQAGYELNGRLIKPALVIVVK
jgi:hypothetical protein